MIKEYYSRLFWGLLITFFDIRFNEFNLLPDFVGYIIIFSALGGLTNYHDIFKKARPLAFVLIFLTIPDLYRGDPNLLAGAEGLLSYSMLEMGVNMISGIIELLLAYYIFEGTRILAVERELKELAQQCHSRWKAYLIIRFLLLLGQPFIWNVPQGIILGGWILLGIGGFIIQILFIALIRTGSEEFHEDFTELE
ncbi:hypothetical protein Amet_4221 [Alkaliphilus metalliredigens QYMF]|uniref:Integral membrane protein n=1 Tax=Alkaliphilus metalliredigens (strain QYMF) TaxID=293826 RepID=A6TVT3_ALKMQ|nr:hypothetical protein [Alkaliphilus metalliredigens]ABR50301.1 hypothetical protein Amet_4221 [Alkaliphilus metalliredigens QYMF]